VASRTHPTYRSPHKALYLSTAVAVLTIVLAYLASYLSGYYRPIELTYNAMEYAYAIDSLYYVISLLLIAVGAFRIASWRGRIAILIGAALLAITLYYSISNMVYLYILLASIVLVVAVELTVLRDRLGRVKATICPYC